MELSLLCAASSLGLLVPFRTYGWAQGPTFLVAALLATYMRRLPAVRLCLVPSPSLISLCTCFFDVLFLSFFLSSSLLLPFYP